MTMKKCSFFYKNVEESKNWFVFFFQDILWKIKRRQPYVDPGIFFKIFRAKKNE